MPYHISESQPANPLTGDIWEKSSIRVRKFWDGSAWKQLDILPVYLELRPDLDFETIRGNAGVPTLVTRGAYRGFSLPVWSTPVNENEELYFRACVPDRWDGASDILLHVDCWITEAEDDKNFKLQVSWEHLTVGADIVPATTHNVEVQTATGALAAQFQSYCVEFVMDYDIDTPDNIVVNDLLQVRLRRVAATVDEAAGEIAICHTSIVYRRDKLGTEI